MDAGLALLANDGLTIKAVTADLGLHAGRLQARYYHRDRMPVSMADCVAAATALSVQKHVRPRTRRPRAG